MRLELIATFLAGASVLIGAVVVRLPDNQRRIAHLSVAIALGALLSLLIFDLLPEMAAAVSDSNGPVPMLALVVVGIVLLRLLDTFVPEHQDHGHNHDTGNALHIGLMSSLALILHNIVEGMTVYSLTYADFRQGMIFAAGVALHNIPVGLLICSSMKNENVFRQVVVFSLVMLSTLLGGLIMMAVSGEMSEAVTGALVAIATGMILYLVFWELLPHVLRTKSRLINVCGTVLGFVLVFISTLMGE